MTNNVMANQMIRAASFDGLRRVLTRVFLDHSHTVHTERWQGSDISRRPEMQSRELLNVTMNVPLMGFENLEYWRQDIAPNLPWADNHFEERVCGYPINPGVEWKNWPWGENAAKFIEEGGQFNHNYMERYWPKHAHAGSSPSQTAKEWWTNEEGEADGRPIPVNEGIRGPYGDIMNLVNLLAEQPLTRQAWIPIFFPEDTGNANEGRKPCTLGYQFIMREGFLHVYYPLRSCDFIRHWADDCYLTVRLLLWVLDECRKINPEVWNKVRPGNYTMQATSLHIFINDWYKMRVDHQ